MANWQATIDIKDVWQKGKAGELAEPELGKSIAEIIRTSCAWGRFGRDAAAELEDIADDLEHCEDTDDIDAAMERLYDWGDYPLGAGKKRAWIKTFI